MAVVPQSPFDSVRKLLAEVNLGNTSDAVRGLWQRFYTRIVEFAEQQLHGRHYAIEDADDVAGDTFYAFVVGVRLGAFPDLKNRDDAWQIMQMIASRKVAALARNESCQKRGGGRQRVDMPAVACSGPSAVQLVAFKDQVRHLLSQLPDAAHAEIAFMKISGSTEEQIAGQLGMSPSSVGRMLDVIRDKWRNELDPRGDGDGGGGGRPRRRL